MKYALQFLENKREELGDLLGRLADAGVLGKASSEVTESIASVRQAADLIRAALRKEADAEAKKKTAAATPAAKKKAKKAQYNEALFAKDRARIAALTEPKKKRGRPRKQLALEDVRLDDDRATDPPPALESTVHAPHENGAAAL